MSQAGGTTHIGIFMENGSGGYLGDLTFVGGAVGMRCGSQQFTSRNLNFQYCSTAIEMIWVSDEIPKKISSKNDNVRIGDGLGKD